MKKVFFYTLIITFLSGCSDSKPDGELKLQFVEGGTDDRAIVRVVVGEYDDKEDPSANDYYVPIDFWSRKQYAENWLKSIDNLLSTGKGSFILLASKPEEADGIETYYAWKKDEDSFVFQNSWIIKEDIGAATIDIESTWKYVPSDPSSDDVTIEVSLDKINALKSYLNQFVSN